MPINRADQVITSGDPNFAAALMSVGCPPADPPVKLVAGDDGKDYLTFRIRDHAIDGTPTMQFSIAWSDAIKRSKMEQAGHGFAKVMAFSSSKRRSTGPSRDAWIEHLADFCQITADAARDAIANVRQICRSSPESDLAYCAAFIANRFALLDAARDFRCAGSIDIFMNHDSGFSLISEKLDAKKRAYLLDKTQ